MEAFLIYEALWHRAETDGVVVHYGGWPDASLAGYFHPRDEEQRDGRPKFKPVIAIRRPWYREPGDKPSRDSNAPSPNPQPNIAEELITLAHEYGHSRSYAVQTDPAEYAPYRDAAFLRDEVEREQAAALPEDLPVREWNERRRRAVYDALSDDQRTRIMREEELAWKIGREVLVEYGFEGLDTYDRTAKHHLHNHRYRLCIDDAWPGDFDEADEGTPST